MPLLKPIRTIQVNSSHPLARGLTGCWLMNEATGEIVSDSGSRRNNGNFHYSSAAPAWKPGRHGSSLEFGSERCVYCGTDKFGWDITSEISVVALANQTASQTNTLFARSGLVRPCRLSAYSSGKFKWWVYTDGTNCIINSTSTHATDGSEFVHVAGVWRPGDGRLYVNGVQEANESSSSGNLNFVNDSQSVGIGSTYEGSNYYYCFSGRIEYVFVYNRVLSSEEIKWLYREPFAMFAKPISPALIAVTSVTVSLAGSASATSAGYAVLTSSGNVPKIELNWLNGALFNGITANSFKLGTTLSLGWFWMHVSGCSALYRGPDLEQIDFEEILTIAEKDACEISPPDYLSHENSSTYFYIVRLYNHCGYQENTFTAIAKVSFDSEGQLEKSQPNNIFAIKAEQIDSDKILFTWFYCPLEQESQPEYFNIYYDNRTGQIDYENALANINYKGRNFYHYKSNSLVPGRYLFAIIAEDPSGIENCSLAQLAIELNSSNPDAITILKAETV